MDEEKGGKQLETTVRRPGWRQWQWWQQRSQLQKKNQH